MTAKLLANTEHGLWRPEHPDMLFWYDQPLLMRGYNSETGQGLLCSMESNGHFYYCVPITDEEYISIVNELDENVWPSKIREVFNNSPYHYKTYFVKEDDDAWKIFLYQAMYPVPIEERPGT